MYKSIDLIKLAMDEHEVNYSVESVGDESAIFASFEIDNGPDLNVIFIADSDANNIEVRVFRFIVGVPENKTMKILKVINECNSNYRFVKFFLDDDNDVEVFYDFPESVSDDCIGEAAYEIWSYFMTILEECYPKFMKVMWEEDEPDKAEELPENVIEIKGKYSC